IVGAVLLHLQALAIVDLGLHGDVVAPLAFGALQGDLHPLVVSWHCGRLPFPDRSAVVDMNYLVILVTRPAPTVRPPSRIAKRNPSSTAISLSHFHPALQ